MGANSDLILASTLSQSSSKLVNVVLVVGGFLVILGAVFLIAERVKGRSQRPLALVICLGPALILALIGLVIPAIQTIKTSFTNQGSIGDRTIKYTGVDNYKYAFTDDATLETLYRTLLWIILVPAAAVTVGLLVALLIDRMKYTGWAKTLIFLPTAISFVGASVIWAYVYNYRDPELQQNGLLSAVVIKLGWKNPPNWLLDQSHYLNTFLLMVIMVWIQAGFAMVVLSAALKAIPEEILEAARMDGATGARLFRTVQIPMIRNTLVVVATTVMIATLKIFDIVFTVTGGNFNTDVLARDMFDKLFVTQQVGRGSALAVILFLCVLPLVAYNVVQMRKERATR